jgi:ABC-2 type transport system permease protein
MREINAILTMAYRDVMKLLRDPTRMISTFLFPLMFIVILGGSMQAMVDRFVYLPFIFTGVFAQTLFQSSALGVISLIDDREHDFSQEIFVSPISRYSIILGKIAGETLVSWTQGLGILVFGLIAGVRFSLLQLVGLTWTGLVVCVFGAAFGVMVLSNLSNRRAADQVFPFIMLPQFFLAGVFNPIRVLPPYLDVLSKIAPMRYAIDLVRSVFYSGAADYAEVVLQPALVNMAIIAAAFAAFLVIGTFLFVRSERNR